MIDNYWFAPEKKLGRPPSKEEAANDYIAFLESTIDCLATERDQVSAEVLKYKVYLIMFQIYLNTGKEWIGSWLQKNNNIIISMVKDQEFLTAFREALKEASQ